MMRKNIFVTPFRFMTAAMFCFLKPYNRSAHSLFSTVSAATDAPQPIQCSKLTPVAKLVDGCDYEHWLIVMEPPKGYPERSQIVHQCVTTLALALGSEEDAKRSIYSVSTKYYYAFGCKISENLTHKIKSLPNVRWVLPDSYLCHTEHDYGGEPFVEGEVVSYDEKYHADWLRDKIDGKYEIGTRSRKSRRKERKKLYGLQTIVSKRSSPLHEAKDVFQ